jgi:hypothetical protein
VRSGTLRPIEYEVTSREQAENTGLTGEAAEYLGILAEVAVLRCVDERGKKLTAIGDPEDLQELLESGKAGDPDGVKLPPGTFPIVLQGWLRAGERRLSKDP